MTAIRPAVLAVLALITVASTVHANATFPQQFPVDPQPQRPGLSRQYMGLGLAVIALALGLTWVGLRHRRRKNH